MNMGSRDMTRTARLGAFILGALILFGVGVFLIGDRQYLFTRTYRLHVPFDTVAGLDSGSVVRSGGVRIGIVDKIEMPRHAGEKVTVVLRLKRATREVIRKDSVALIESEGLLGAKFVSVSFGSKESEPVRDGDTIASRPPLEYGDLAKKVSATLETVDTAVGSLQSIVAKVDRGEGTIGALINDKKVAQDLNRTMSEAKAGVTAFREDMEALKSNPLLRGHFTRRGYSDATELTKYEIASLPRGPALKTFVYAAKDLFDKPDTAKLRNEKSLKQVGEFLQETPFGVAVVTAYTGPEGEKERNRQLTQARALVVREYLAKNFKMDDTRIKTKGMGEDAQADSKRADRVEILVYPAAAERRVGERK
jgi:phospholipid/cholesterol/gamma-HCH transport system substrate-binding protein